MAHLARTLALGLTLWIALVAPRDASAGALPAPPDSPADQTCTPADHCCMICNKGYACGNSCISRAKQCHKGRGCACNASEVCAGR